MEQGELSNEEYALLSESKTEKFIKHQNSGPYDLGKTEVHIETQNQAIAFHNFALSKLEGDFEIVDIKI